MENSISGVGLYVPTEASKRFGAQEEGISGLVTDAQIDEMGHTDYSKAAHSIHILDTESIHKTEHLNKAKQQSDISIENTKDLNTPSRSMFDFETDETAYNAKECDSDANSINISDIEFIHKIDHLSKAKRESDVSIENTKDLNTPSRSMFEFETDETAYNSKEYDSDVNSINISDAESIYKTEHMENLNRNHSDFEPVNEREYMYTSREDNSGVYSVNEREFMDTSREDNSGVDSVTEREFMDNLREDNSDVASVNVSGSLESSQ